MLWYTKNKSGRFRFTYVLVCMSKYKYYLKKPKSSITKDVFLWLAIAGSVTIAASSPYFGVNLAREFAKKKKYKQKDTYDAFRRLKKEGCIIITKKNHQIYIRLTEKGRERAGVYQINDLAIKRPKRWDGKWRLVLFDIEELKRQKREAFRGMLKNLGLKPLQQSVWICPYECKDEIDLLRDFFGLHQQELRYIITDTIGEDADWRKEFGV
jgi:DNA-binding PadR family transcriptional regulator